MGWGVNPRQMREKKKERPSKREKRRMNSMNIAESRSRSRYCIDSFSYRE